MISLQESHLIHSPSAMMTLLALPPDSSALRLNHAMVCLRLPSTGRGGLEGVSPASFTQPSFQPGDEISALFHQRPAPRALFHHPHDLPTDARAVGEASDGCDRRRRADTEPAAPAPRRHE